MKYGAWPAGAGSVYRSRAFELDSNVRAPFPPWARLLGLLRADLVLIRRRLERVRRLLRLPRLLRLG